MAISRRTLLQLVLAATAAAQGTVLLVRRDPSPVMIQTGAPFSLPISKVADGSPALIEGRCVAVYLLGPNCAHSKIPRNERREFTDPRIDVAWVVLGSREAALRFAEELDYDPEELAFVDPRPSMVLRLLGTQRLSLPGTPFRLLLDAQHMVRDAVLGAARLSEEQISPVCQ